jgi:hypothetical protein
VLSPIAWDPTGRRSANHQRHHLRHQKRAALGDAPSPHKTICNRFIRWSRLGAFNAIFAKQSSKGGKPDQLMIDATTSKPIAPRPACSKKRGLFPDVSDAPKAA